MSFGEEGIYRPRYCINCRRRIGSKRGRKKKGDEKKTISEVCQCGMQTTILEQKDDKTIIFEAKVVT